MLGTLRRHWPEYLIEATGLGFFLVVAGLADTVLEYPPVRQAIPDPVQRRMLMALVVGLTVVLIVYSPWGKRSGAHINPAVTLTFLRLGKVQPWDAAFYVLAQFAGGSLGAILLARVVGHPFVDPPVLAIATLPGAGVGVAFLAEAAMSFGLMLLVLVGTNSRRLAPVTGLLVGALVASYIAVEAPLSGMSINPARSFASALTIRYFRALWIYLTAPPLGMLLAAEVYRRLMRRPVHCAKIRHPPPDQPCIFNCDYRAAARPAGPSP